jgi:hypothetical protein
MRSTGIVAVVLLAVGASLPASADERGRLFPSGIPTAAWSRFQAAGFGKPLTGIVYRKGFRPVCGAPIGALDTGCLDIETSGLLGYSSIFNDLSPRGGPVNQPLLGLSIGGRTWVLTTGQTKTYDPGSIPPLPGGVTPEIAGGTHKLLTVIDENWQKLGPALAVGDDAFPVVLKPAKDTVILKAGDVGGHTPAVPFGVAYGNYSWVKWTAPTETAVHIVGGVWSNFDFRTCDFVIRHNGRDIYGGLPDGKLQRHTIDYRASSQKPEPFALRDVKVRAKDEIVFAFRTNGRVLADPRYPGMGTFYGLRVAIQAEKQAWDLAKDWKLGPNPNGAWSYGANEAIAPPPSSDLPLIGVKKADDIEYFGHYPVIDMEFVTGAPVAVGARIWSPFLPGDIKASNTPGAVFEIHLRNTTSDPQTGTVAFSFPGFKDHQTTMRQVGFPHWAATPQPPKPKVERREIVESNMRGVCVSDRAWHDSYALTVLAEPSVRTGGKLGNDGAKWAALATSLPTSDLTDTGTSLAVNFTLRPGERRVVRFVLAWHAPQWEGSGTPFTGEEKSKVAMDLTGSKPFEGGRWYTHMYATRYADAVAVARFLAENHASLLRRVLAWQEVIYTDPEIAGWLADSLINILYLYPECSVWAQAKPPIGAWCKPEDGLFGMIESARSCPQMECLPVTAISGIVPTVCFFPELVRVNARGWKAYQLPSGQMRFNFGLYWDMTTPNAEGNQEVMNGGNYMAILDRYWVATKDDTFIREFYDSAKKACLFSFEKQRPAYGLAQIAAMRVAGGESPRAGK